MFLGHVNIRFFRVVINSNKSEITNLNTIQLITRYESGLVTSRAEPSFEQFELGLLIYERARARAELLNELKIRLKLGLI